MDLGLPNFAVDAAIVIAVVAAVALLVLARPRAPRRRLLTLAEVQAGLHRTGIVAIEGERSGMGLAIYARNRSNTLVEVTSEPGTVVEASEPGWQNLLVVRPQAFVLPAKTTQRFDLEALGLDASKRVPGLKGEGGYRVGAVTSEDKILRLLVTLDELETEIARQVQRIEGDQVRYRAMSDDLTILASQCTFGQAEEGGYQARIADAVVQQALWQVAGGVGFDDLAELVLKAGMASARAQAIGQILAANIVVAASGMEPPAKI
jgi:hypothetical protein